MDALVDETEANLETVSMTDTGSTWNLSAAGLTMLYAGDVPGDTLYGESRIAIEPGTYRVLHAAYTPPGIAVYVYRLIPESQQLGAASDSAGASPE